MALRCWNWHIRNAQATSSASACNDTRKAMAPNRGRCIYSQNVSTVSDDIVSNKWNRVVTVAELWYKQKQTQYVNMQTYMQKTNRQITAEVRSYTQATFYKLCPDICCY
jgi:hypothetical protein